MSEQIANHQIPQPEDDRRQIIAEQLGKDPVTISKWCTNTTQPDLQTLSRISDLLNIDIRELLVSRNQPVQPLTKDIK